MKRLSILFSLYILLSLFSIRNGWVIQVPQCRRNSRSRGEFRRLITAVSESKSSDSLQKQIDDLLQSLPTISSRKNHDVGSSTALNLSNDSKLPDGVITSPENTNQRVYVPRSYRNDAPRTPRGNSQNGNNRKPSVENSSPKPPQYKEVILLTNPQLLVQYRIPREITPRKKELLELAKNSNAGTRRSSGDRSVNALTKINPIAIDEEEEEIEEGRRRDKAKDGEKKRLEELAAAAEEKRKKKASGKATSGTTSTQKRKGAVNKVVVEEVFDEDDQTVLKLVSDDGNDLFEETADDDMSRIPISFFRMMDEDGLSYEQIQRFIFTEYGKTVTIDDIRKKMQSFDGPKRKKRKTKQQKFQQRERKQQLAAEAARNALIILPMKEMFSIHELSELMKLSAGELIKYLMFNEGMMITMNQMISRELTMKLLQAFDKDYREEGEIMKAVDRNDNKEEVVKEENKKISSSSGGKRIPRAPVVTIMGHVDHGKTTLLDTIRQTQVAATEAGGITQAITAFNVHTNTGKNITFIDTPGHAAFSEMRLRGAKMTDIVVLVVAADDGVMEQTKECIEAARMAQCPIVVAINKIDKEGVDINQVKSGLLQAGIILEELGGDIQAAEISAKNNIGIQALLEKILIQAEVMELQSDPEAPVEATIVEAKIDKGLGVVATALIQQGTIRNGQIVVAGPAWGKVRFLTDDRGQIIPSAGPSQPVRVVGLNRVPNAGDQLIVTETEDLAKDMADAILKYEKKQVGASTLTTLQGVMSSIASGSYDTREIIKVPIVLKTDVGGSLEAIRKVLEDITSEDEESICKIDIVYSGVGDVTTSDILMATAAKAKIIAFNVAATGAAINEARSENINIQYYQILYEIIDEITELVKSTLTPPPPGEWIGTAEVKKIFRIGKNGKVAGCIVTEGKIVVTGNIRIVREKKVIHSGTMASLRIVKENVPEVSSGNECGIQIKDFDELQEGDMIQCFLVQKESGEDSLS